MEILTEQELARIHVLEYVDTLAQDATYSLAELTEKYGDGLMISIETDWWYDECSITIKLERNRLETDEEYISRTDRLRKYRIKSAEDAEKRRLASEKKKADKLANERKLYLELKKKFED